MERLLKRVAERGYLVLRLGVAFLLIFHAPHRWLGWFGGPAWPLTSIRSLGSVFVCMTFRGGGRYSLDRQLRKKP